MKHGEEQVTFLEQMSRKATHYTGTSEAFLIAASLILIWLAAGPFAGFSTHWESVLFATSDIVTLMMVFLIQRSQNKDSAAMQIKLNEIIAAIHGANNKIINVEQLSEAEIKLLVDHYSVLAEKVRNKEMPSNSRVSIDDVKPS